MSSNIEAKALSGTRKCRILAKCFAKTRKGDKRLQTIIAKRFVTLMDKRRERREFLSFGSGLGLELELPM